MCELSASHQEIINDQIKVVLDDEHNIGTDKYAGLAYFWNYEYRHYLRDALQKK